MWQTYCFHRSSNWNRNRTWENPENEEEWEKKSKSETESKRKCALLQNGISCERAICAAIIFPGVTQIIIKRAVATAHIDRAKIRFDCIDFRAFYALFAYQSVWRHFYKSFHRSRAIVEFFNCFLFLFSGALYLFDSVLLELLDFGRQRLQ